MTSTSLENLHPPVGPGNRLAVTHGFFVTRLKPEDEAQVTALTESFRELCPAYSRSLDPMLELAASTAWRLQRANADLAEHGLMRGTKAAALLKHVEAAERTLIFAFGKLGMTTKDAAELGLTLTRARRESIDLSRLSPEKQEQLRELLQEAGALDGP